MTLFIWAEKVIWCQAAGIPAECDYKIMYSQISAICSGGFTGFYRSEEAEIKARMKNTAVDRMI